MRNLLPARSERKLYLLLFVVSLIACGASIGYVHSVAKTSGTVMGNGYPTPDATMPGEFATLTINMVERGVFSMATTSPYTPNMWRTPGYSAFMAPFYAVFESFYPVLFAQILLVFLTTIIVFKMARRVLSERAALWVSLAYIVLPTTLLSAATIMNETLFTLVFLLALYVLLFSETGSLYGRFALTGFLLALGAYIKPAGLYILFFLIPAYFVFYLPWKSISRRHIFATLILVLTFAATLFPWSLRNHTVLNSWEFASTSAFQLFRHNATQFYEAYHDIPNIEARYALQDRAGLPRGAVPLDTTYSAVMKKVALEVIFEHPFSYAVFHVSTFIPFFASSGLIDYERYIYVMVPEFDPAEEPSLLQAIHPLSIPLLLVVLKNHGWTLLENFAWAFAFLLVLLGLWQGKDVRLARMLFAIMLYFAVVTGPIAHARYRAPVEPFILIGAVAAAAYYLERYPQWRRYVPRGSRTPQQ